MKRIFTICILLVIFQTTLVQCQGTESIVSLKVLGSTDKFKVGENHSITIALTIKEPFHINAHEPTDEFLIPTAVKFKSQNGLTIGTIKYPAPEHKKFVFSEEPLAVYENTVYIFTHVTVASDIQENKIVIEGILGFQACDDQSCQAPDETVFSQEFSIAKGSETVTLINQDIFAQQQSEAGEKEIAISLEDNFGKTAAEKGLLWTFILVFLGGLALNLTPCVYPLIPITISYFGGQTQGKKSNLVAHAMLYVLGMAITYSILGMIAAFTGSLFGAALQNPIVLAVIAFILVSLSLSMFDLYEIRVPAFLSNFAGGAKQGFFGTFFMGLTVGIVAAPCIGPFVLALLTYVGEKGSVLLGFSLFFVLALGMGVPFLFLGIFSGSINKLPRSGAWMIWVRSIFGFILIGMAVYFLQPLFPNALLFHFSLALVLFVGGIYMAWIESTETPGKVFPIVRNLIGVVFFILALLVAANGVQSYVDKSVAEAQAEAGILASAEKITWSEYSEQKLGEAKNQHKPVMIDFYADWCIPCKELDKFTFSQLEVVEMSKNFLMLKVDLTTENSPQSKELKNKFRIKGVPTLVFLNSEGKQLDDLRVVGFMGKEKFLPIMKRALN